MTAVVPPPRLGMSVTEAAKSVGIGRSMAYELVRAGEWPVVRIGHRMIVPVAGLKTWLDDHQEAVS